MSIAARRSHRGDEYQIAVAAQWVIQLLCDARIASVQIDAVSLPESPDTVDVDDVVITYDDGTTRHVQAKKNQTDHRSWEISDSVLKDELVKAHLQLQKTPNATIEFCSQTPFGDLAKIVESTRDFANHEAFEAQATANLKTTLGRIQDVLQCSGKVAFNLMARFEIGSAHNHAGWRSTNLAVLTANVNDSETALDVIERMIRDNQSGLSSPLTPLTREQVLKALERRDVFLRNAPVNLDTDEILRAFSTASIDLADWKTTLPNDEWLERQELATLQERITEQPSSVTLVLGEPGCGKSALLARLAGENIALGIPVLAIKSDYLSEQVNDTSSLGEDLGLPADPIACVLAIAERGKVVVLIDQLDALADLVVQHSQRLRGPLDLIRGLSGVENVHVIASCRAFEHRHDTRLRNLEAEALILELPEWEKVDAALKKYGINAGAWNASIRDDLRAPQTLNLFLQLAPSTNEADLLLGYQHMLGELWKQQVLSDHSGRAREALFKITECMAEREMLWLPEALFDEYHRELRQLSRSGILICDSGRVGFRHQTLYEYVRVRIFLGEPGKLTDTILERQHSLRVRPLLWHSLAYMRAVDPHIYAQEIDKLWSAALRRHLKMLLIEFLGQLQDPSSSEATLLIQRWDDPWYQSRILGTIAGSPGWFDRLADSHVSQVMQLPVDQARRALPVLCQVMSSRQEHVLGLVKNHWQADPGKDPLTWIVLEQVHAWDEGCIALCQEILGRTKIDDWQVNHLVTVLSAALPDRAPVLVGAWLNHEMGSADQADLRADRARELMNGQRMHDLPAIAEAAPGAFLDAVWPWALSAIKALARDPHEFVIGYSESDSSFHELDDEDVRVEKPFIAAISSAVRALAHRDPGRFIDFVSANQQLNLMPVHQLLTLGLVQLAPHEPAIALDYLTRDPRRLAIGTYRDVHAASKRLIQATVPHLDGPQVNRLEQAIRNWNRYAPTPDHDAKTRFHRLKWNRERRLKLLRAIPVGRLSVSGKRLVVEEERAFPGLRDADVWTAGMREIGSPMQSSSMQAASEAQILNLFGELTDQTRWDHPRHVMQGGVIQASRELAEFTKAAPERAIHLIRMMEPGKNEIAVGAVVRALGENKYDANTLYALILELNRKGFNGEDFRENAANTIGSIVDAHAPIPQEIFQLLVSWLADAPEETTPAEEKESSAPSSSILWSHGGIAILPHGNFSVLSALSKACLRVDPPDTDQWLSLLERHLLRKENKAVWLAMTRYLQWLHLADRPRAQRLLIDVFATYPDLFDSKAGVILLAHSQHWISTEAAIAQIDIMFARESEFANQAAGELLMLRYVLRDGGEPNITKILQRQLGSARTDAAYTSATTGIAYTVAELWKEAHARPLVHPYLLQLLASQDGEVIAAAAGVFFDRRLRHDAASRELLALMQTRPDLLQIAGNDNFGECLVSLLEQEPQLVAEVAFALLESIGDDFSNHRASRYFLQESLLTIALHLQEMGGRHQELGAHIFERILEFSSSEVRSVLIDLDKRTPNSESLSPPRRRRKRP